MVTPAKVHEIDKDDFIYAQRWLRLHEPDMPRRRRIDIEHSINECYPGGITALVNREHK